MASTNFVPGTVVTAQWLNEIDAHVFDGQQYDTINTVNAMSPVWGIVADGTTDNSTALQALIDANKGKRIVFNGSGEILMAGITLDGSSYNNTSIEFTGPMEFKLKGDGSIGVFGGAWFGILVKECSGVSLLNINWNGNRAAMVQREQIFCAAFAGASFYKVHGGTIREIRGDGIYISSSDWTGASTASFRGEVIGVTGYNTASDGRNLVTVISADDLEITSVTSRYIGGIISGFTMPGGIDVEPDHGYQPCNDIRIHDCYVLSAGTSGIAVLGKAITNDATADWNSTNTSVKNCTVKMIAGTGVAGPAFVRLDGLELDIRVQQLSGTRNRTLVIDGAKNVQGRATVRGGFHGVHLGATLRVDGFNLDINSTDYSASGIRTNDIRNGVITGRVYGATSSSNTFAIDCNNEGRSGIVQTNVTYSVDCPFDGNVVRGFRNEPSNPVTYSNSFLLDCAFGGYTSFGDTIDAGIRAANVIGVTEGTPGSTFSDGDTTPSVVLPATRFTFDNSSATSVTMFDDGYEDRVIVVRMSPNTTIVHNTSNIRLKGATNISGRTFDDWIVLRQTSGIWYEQHRSW